MTDSLQTDNRLVDSDCSLEQKWLELDENQIKITELNKLHAQKEKKTNKNEMLLQRALNYITSKHYTFLSRRNFQVQNGVKTITTCI